MKHAIAMSLCCAMFMAPAHAADLSGLMRSKPVLSITTGRKLYDLERCMINVDAPIMPQVYRQPDRPEQVVIVWDGNGGGLGGVAAAVRIEGLDHASVTFWGREKIMRRIEPCLGPREQG